RTVRTLAGAAGALLAPRLRPAAGDFGARLRALRAGASRGQLRGDDLVHDRDVRLDAEDRVVEIDGAGRRARAIAEVDGGHQLAFPLAGFLTALRMRTMPPFGPGTLPRTRTRSRSASASTTSRFSVVVFSPPMRPAIFMPLNTRAGVAHAPIEP